VGYDTSSPAFLVYYPCRNNVKKIRFIKFTEKLDSVDESVNLLPESVKPANLKCYILKISREVIGVTPPVLLD